MKARKTRTRKQTDAGEKSHDGYRLTPREVARTLDHHHRDHRVVHEGERYEKRPEQGNRLHPENRRRDPEGSIEIEELAAPAEKTREHAQETDEHERQERRHDGTEDHSRGS